MSLSHVIGGGAVVAIVLSMSAIAQSEIRGTVTEIQDDGRKLVLKTSAGKATTVGVSGSRTKVTAGGKEGSLAAVKAGMTCTATGSAGAEATSLDCS